MFFIDSYSNEKSKAGSSETPPDMNRRPPSIGSKARDLNFLNLVPLRISPNYEIKDVNDLFFLHCFSGIVVVSAWVRKGINPLAMLL